MAANGGEPTIQLVQRTPFLLCYEVTVRVAGARVVIPNARLVEDASAWRDRPIHKLVSVEARRTADAVELTQRTFQGIGLTEISDANVMRGRLSVTSSTPHLWGVTAGPFDNQSKPNIVVMGPNDVVDEATALVYLEIERNR